MVAEMREQLESHILTLREFPVVLSTFQSATKFDQETRDLYVDVAKRSSLVAAFGSDMDDDPAPGVKGANIVDGDPLQDEWDLVAVGPHFAAALAALDMGVVGPAGERRFNYAVTYDREVVLSLALSLLGRVLEAPL